MQQQPRNYHVSLLNKLNSSFRKDLHVCLAPARALGNNVEELAGRLGFDTDYVINKKHSFIYLMNIWIKRDKGEATLDILSDELFDMGRLDAVEIIDKAIKDLNERNLKENVAYEDHLQRFPSNTTLFNNNLNERNLKENITYEDHLQRFPSNTTLCNNSVSKYKHKEGAPAVMVVYYPDNDTHVTNVKRFIKKLRKRKINATTDFFKQAELDVDKALYYSTEILKAQFVILVCSPEFYCCEKDTEKSKELSFINKMMRDHIFNSGQNDKYIPVLLANLCKEEYIPSLLRSYTIYKIPRDTDKLVNRMLKKETYKIPPTPPDCNLSTFPTDSIKKAEFVRKLLI